MMKRIAVLHSTTSDPDRLKEVGDRIRNYLDGPDENTFMLTSTDPEYVLQILQIDEDDNNRYRVATITKNGIKIEDIDTALYKEKW
jgi:hypothetical protein